MRVWIARDNTLKLFEAEPVLNKDEWYAVRGSFTRLPEWWFSEIKYGECKQFEIKRT